MRGFLSCISCDSRVRSSRSDIAGRRWQFGDFGRRRFEAMKVTPPNQPDAANPAIASWFHAEDQWRGVADQGQLSDFSLSSIEYLFSVVAARANGPRTVPVRSASEVRSG